MYSYLNNYFVYFIKLFERKNGIKCFKVNTNIIYIYFSFSMQVFVVGDLNLHIDITTYFSDFVWVLTFLCIFSHWIYIHTSYIFGGLHIILRCPCYSVIIHLSTK